MDWDFTKTQSQDEKISQTRKGKQKITPTLKKQYRKALKAQEIIKGLFPTRTINELICNPLTKERKSQEETSRSLFCVLGGLSSIFTQLDLKLLQQLFSQFGTVELLKQLEHPSVVFVVFSDKEEAVRAYQSLNDREVMELGINRYFHIEYSQLEFKELDLPSSKEELNSPIRMGIVNAIEQEIPGLHIFKNFITDNEELNLFEEIEKGNWDILKHRKVQHFGFQFQYSFNGVNKDSPISISSNSNPNSYLDIFPMYCRNVLERIVSQMQKSFGDANSQSAPIFIPDQLTINSYEPGGGIPDHIDTHSQFSQFIVSLSLLGDVVMEFKQEQQQQQHRAILIPRKSLFIMTGECRYAWKHGITPRKQDCVNSEFVERKRRISLTFRKVLQDKCCHCNFEQYCDNNIKSLHEKM